LPSSTQTRVTSDKAFEPKNCPRFDSTPVNGGWITLLLPTSWAGKQKWHFKLYYKIYTCVSVILLLLPSSI
jgi:hypothetical protein